MKQFRLFILAFVFLWGVVHQELAFAAAGKFLFVNGDVAVVETSGKQHKGQKGDELNEGDSVVTSANGFAQIKMEDGGAISVRPDTNFKINKFQYSGKEDGSEKSHFSLSKGSIRSVTGAIGKKHRENYKIETATATIGVRGSGADVGHADSIGTAVHTLFGGHSISTNLDGKTLTLETKPGQTALVAPGSAPQFVPSFPFSTAVAPPSKGEEKGSDSKQKSGDAKEEKSSKDEKSSKEQKSSDAKDSKKEESKSSDSQNKNSESKSASDTKSDSSAGNSQSTSSESTSSNTNTSSSTSTSQSSSTSQQTTSSATSSQPSSMQTAAPSPSPTASLTTSSSLTSTGGGLSATSMTISPVAQIAAPVVPVLTEIKTTTDLALTSTTEVATAVTATATALASSASTAAQFSVNHTVPANLGLAVSVYDGYFNDSLSFFTSNNLTASAFQNQFPVKTSVIGCGATPCDIGDYYSVVYKGFFKPTYTGSYMFVMGSDDASYLWIGNQGETQSALANRVVASSSQIPAINNQNLLAPLASVPGIHPVGYSTGNVNLTAGQLYPVLLYFGENDGGDAFYLDRIFMDGTGYYQNNNGVFYTTNPDNTTTSISSFTVANIANSSTTTSLATSGSLTSEAESLIASNSVTTKSIDTDGEVVWGRWSCSNCSVTGEILTIAAFNPISISAIDSLRGLTQGQSDIIGVYTNLVSTSPSLNGSGQLGGYLYSGFTNAIVNFSTGTMALTLSGMGDYAGLQSYTASSASNAAISSFMNSGIALTGQCFSGGCSANGTPITGTARGGFVGSITDQSNNPIAPQGVIGTFALTNGVQKESGTFYLKQ